MSKKKSNRAFSKAPEILHNTTEVYIPDDPNELEALEKIYELLAQVSQVDFSHYRNTTVYRRMNRRMSLCKRNTYVLYLDYLQTHADEVDRLYEDLLLSFTYFFRDSEIYDTLHAKIFPEIIKDKDAKHPIRIWIAGCSTGEEVYSMAISICEFLEKQSSKLTVQIFGTDLVGSHIVKARTGIYKDEALRNVSASNKEKYFEPFEGGWKVIKQLREICIFAIQDLISDPPFPNIDLISCRNVLIYFDATLQNIAIPRFHFALNENGFLLLGSSESMNSFSQLFKPFYLKNNIYARRATSVKPTYPFIASKTKTKLKTEKVSVSNSKKSFEDRIINNVSKLLINEFSPPGVVVDSSLQILQFIGQTHPFLSHKGGNATLKLSHLVADGLMADLYILIEDAKRNKAKTIKEGIGFSANHELIITDIIVIPEIDPQTGDSIFIVLFQQNQRVETLHIDDSLEPNSENTILKKELLEIKKKMRALLEDKENVIQELWSASEEIQSSNEELQSINEELEAAKEELESSNEELITVNEELVISNHELNRSKHFTDNLIKTANGLLIVLDGEGKIVLFNEEAERITGYMTEELDGKNWIEVLMPNDKYAASRRKFEQLSLKEGIPTKFENLILTKQGQERIISWRNAPVFENDQVTGSVSFGLDITDIKRRDQRLEWYANIVEQSLNEIYIFDQDTWRFKDVNPAACKNLGYNISELKQLTPLDIKPEFSKKEFEVLVSPLIKGTQQKIVFQTVHQRKDKSTYHTEVHLQLLDGDFVAMIIDTSDKIAAQKSVQDSEYRYRTLIETTTNSVHELDLDGNFLSVNNKGLKLLGAKTEGQMIGTNFLDHVSTKDAEVVRQYLAQAIKSRRSVEFEYQLKKSDQWMSSSFTPIMDLGQPVRLLGMTKDISERKAYQKQLFALIEQLGNSQEIAQLGSFEYFEKKKQFWCSEGLFKLFDVPFTKEFLTQKEFYQMIDKNDLLDLPTQMDQAMGGGEFFSAQFSGNGSARGSRWYQIVVRADKKGGGVMGTIQDITLSRQIEKERQNMHNLKSIGTLAGGIAHDFNNMMLGVFSNISMAKAQLQKNNKSYPFLLEAELAMSRSKSLTNQLLTFSKGGEPIRKDVSLSDLAKEIVKFDLTGSNVKPVFDIDPELWIANVDKGQIQQVFSNLTLNGDQAMPQGGRLFVGITNHEIEVANKVSGLNKGSYLKIIFRDEGMGMDDNMIRQIFDPYFTTKEFGSGLGMSIVYSIVQKHGGHIQVESQLDVGTTFTIYLPASRQNHIDVSTPKKTKKKLRKEFPKVLIMDDNEMIRKIISRSLLEAGYEVETAEDGQMTLDLYQAAMEVGNPFELVIMDMTIPGGMGGEEAIKKLLELDPEACAIISSGYAEDQILAHFDYFGFKGILPKPYTVEDLEKVIQKVCY